MRVILPCVVLALIAAPVWLAADGGDEDPVSRDEALAIKGSVKSVLEALGTPPAGYAKATEEFELPTAMGVDKAAGRFYLAETRAEFEFKNGVSGEELSREYQAKIMAAQAKGDYAAIQRLTQELQQNSLVAAGVEMAKITVKVGLNDDPYQTIDPEGVIWESAGAIALRTGTTDNNTEVMLAFDPKALADTKQISLVSLGESVREPASRKTAVRTIVVRLIGPDAPVTEWAKNVDKGKMLALIGG